MSFSFHKKNIRRGFTLVETLVAIAVLMVALTAVFSVVQSGLSSTIAVKDRVTSFFLAQEALEAVRNTKDTNLLAQYVREDPNNPYWLAGILPQANACPNGGSSFMDYDAATRSFIDCSSTGGVCDNLKIDSNGLLQHTSGIGGTSRFSRKIVVHEICTVGAGNQKEAEVTVTVSWPGHPNGLVITDNITNWFSI